MLDECEEKRKERESKPARTRKKFIYHTPVLDLPPAKSPS